MEVASGLVLPADSDLAAPPATPPAGFGIGGPWGKTSPLKPGDTAEVEVEGAGILTNSVVAEK
jgi:2-keto-4-pentenoate hydratase/2-oxohepta-3-ene-1,7-dioic acid hydratase in catechol pathway